MSHSGILKQEKARKLLNLVLAALLVLTTLVIIPSVANATEDVVPEEPIVEETTTTAVAEEPAAEQATTTTVAAVEPIVEETTTTTTVAEEPAAEQATTTTVAVEEPAVEETTTTTTTTTMAVAEKPAAEQATTTTVAAIEPIVEETTTTVATEPATAEAAPAAEEPIVEETVTDLDAADQRVAPPVVVDEDVEELLTYKITLVKRVCESYQDINKNFANPNNLSEAIGTLGDPITWATVTAANEEPNTDCSPLSGWNFSIGTGFSSPTQADPPGTLSQVTGNYGTPIVTQASTPWLDEFGDPTGANLSGAVTIDLTQEQADRAFLGERRLWISEGTNGADGAVIPDGFEFGILRCGVDNRNADNVEWITFPKGATHVVCYAYNVGGAGTDQVPDLNIDKVAVDIDGEDYVDGDEANVGQTINYEVTVTNTGDVDLTDVVVTDPGLDAPGLTCAWPNGDGALAVGDGNAATLGDGDTVVCTGSHVATAGDATAGDYTNTANAHSDEYELSKDADETVPVVPQVPDVDIDKVAVDIDGVDYVDGDIAKVGQTINYEVTVTNTGNVALSDLVVSDPGLDAPGLNCTWPNGDGVLAVGDGLAATLDDGDTVVCVGSHVATSDDASIGDFYNISTTESEEWEISESDDEVVLVDYTFQITFVKRVCESYDDILTNFANPDNLVEAAEPLGGGQVTWRPVTPADEEPSTGCSPLTGWDFSIGDGFTPPTDPGTLSQVTGNFGTVIQTQASTPLLDEFGQDTGDDLPGAVTIDLTDEQAALAAKNQSLWVQEGLNGPDGAVIPDGFGFGILRCGVDNRNGDNVEWIKYLGGGGRGEGEGEPQGLPLGLLGDNLQAKQQQTHVFCYAYNVALNPQIQVTKTVDKPEIVAKDTVEFTIEIENTGNVVLNDLTLDDVMTYGDVGIEDLVACEIPDATTLDPGDSTQAQCSVDLDSSTHGESVLNTVTATATPQIGDDVSDTDDVTVTIIPPSPNFLNASCISEPIAGFGFSLDQPLLEWSTTDWGPTFDTATDTLELRIWSNDQDPTTDAPSIVYEIPWDSDLLGQEPYASAAGAPGGDRIVVDGGQGYLYWPGYDNSGWTGPENGLAGIVYPGTEWRPTAYQFAFNPETAVTVVEYPPATVDCVPGGAISIDKLVGPLGTSAGSADFVDGYARAVDEVDVTWQVTIQNLTDYTLFEVDFTDDFEASCVTAFEAVAQANDMGFFMTPQEELVFTCDSNVGNTETTNTATVGGIDLWGSVIIPVSDDATTFPPFTIVTIDLGSIGDTVWSDTNDNGVQDNGEQGIENVTVRMTMPDLTTLDATTDANGLYLFASLEPGEYTVEVILSSIPAPTDGTLKATTATSYTLLLAKGETNLDADFGVVVIGAPVTITEELPNTGLSTDQILLIAVVMLILGGTALLVSRRKRDDEGTLTA